MFKLLIRLYLVTIVTFAAAIYGVPEVIIHVFHERFMNYNEQMSRGTQGLLVKQFEHVPEAQWPALAADLNARFQPLNIDLRPIADPGFSADEQRQLHQGKDVLRIGEWGMWTRVASPLNQTHAIEMSMSPDPFDMNVLYWSINVLIGAALLGGLLLWLRPHWRDLEQLPGSARGN